MLFQQLSKIAEGGEIKEEVTASIEGAIEGVVGVANPSSKLRQKLNSTITPLPNWKRVVVKGRTRKIITRAKVFA